MRLFLFFIFSLPFWAFGKPDDIKLDSTLVAQLNPAHFKTDFSRYDQKTALFCGYLSDAAYLDPSALPALEDTLNARYGKETYRFIDIASDATNTRALLCVHKRFVIVAFRGTQFKKPKDLLTDIKRRLFLNTDTVDELLRDLPGGHRGFRNGAAELIQNQHIFDSIDKYSLKGDLPVYLTGHSMGAAYASLFVQPIARRFTLGGAYNFAPPLAIYCPEAEAISRKYGAKVHDIVNYKDYVTRATPYLRRHTMHIGTFYRISKKQSLLYRERERYVGWFKGEIGLRKIIGYHTLDSYLKALALPGNSTAAVEDRHRRGRFIFGKLHAPVRCKPCKEDKLRYGF